ncbi:MAG: alpha/beta hydrolase fold domain-containing protein, partial [Treponema sp.]|nr:alpha/beta hydrolase fold domain-containing protein [Treponema sp.]
YIHGGSFVGGSRASWRGFCARLAAKSFSRVVVPEFRLAPTFPYPAAIEDVQTVFRAVFTELQVACTLDESVSSGPVKPEIVIATDSSGASIASALLFNMRERYRASLTHLVLLSPWLNFTQDENHKKRSDELISSETLSECGTAYTYAANLQNHLVSPLLAEAEMLKGFPPVYIQVGEKELLLEDYKKFAELLTQAKISCKLDVWKNMPSLFQFSDESLWETHLALEKIGKLISGSTSETGVHVENQPMLESGIKAEA